MRGIGRMARDTGLTVSALRFYDGAGLLVPAHVDPWNGYRYYSDDQLVAARLLARLRRVGMPLADISRVLEHRRDPSVVDEVLRAHLTRLEDGLADARRELFHARALLDQESRMTTTVRTTAAQLRRALSAVRHAVGTDPELPMLTGVLLDATDGAPRVVATDRYRLAVRTIAGGAVEGAPAAVLLPTPLVDAVLASLGDDDAPVAVQVAGSSVTVGDARGEAADHDFPDYRRFLGDRGEHRFDVDVTALRSELAAAPTRTVPDGPAGGEQTATVLTLGGREMGVNREFLLEALDAGGAGQLVLDLDGPLGPLAIRDPERPGDVSLLMPIRLSA